MVVNLNWAQSTSSRITGNNLYRSTSGSGGPYNLLANTDANTSYTNTSVENGNTYFYSVSAVSAGGESALSSYAGATPVATTYYKFQNRAAGLFLDGMSRTSDGYNAGQWSDSNSHNQQWSVLAQ